jgi:small-conductance mechanosensitive channel
LRSTLFRAILKQFADNGILIPFPQRDVRIIGSLPMATTRSPDVQRGV